MRVDIMYSPAERERIASHILAELALGRSLRKIIAEDKEEHGLPDIATWLSWQVSDPSLHEQVARAREHGAERLVEEMVEIADDKQGDTDPQSRRVRIYAREKAAAMLAPKRFGQKLDVTSGGKPLPEPKSVTLIDNRIQSVLMLVQQRKDDDETIRGLLE